MKIKEVMTVDVLTVPTGKTLKETAQLLGRHRDLRDCRSPTTTATWSA